MFHVFDNAGWYASSSEVEVPRSTQVDPINYSITEVAGEMRANWTGYIWVDREFVPPAPVIAVPGQARVTRLGFRMRFTQAEKVGLEIASLDNPSAELADRALAAGLRVALADQRDATFIDLGDAYTRAGVVQLEQFGLLAAGRAAEILDAPVSPEEQYGESALG